MDKKILNELETYARLDGNEIGEAISLMLSLRGYVSYVDEDVIHAIESELLEIHKWFKENTRIVKKESPKEYYYDLEYIQ